MIRRIVSGFLAIYANFLCGRRKGALVLMLAFMCAMVAYAVHSGMQLDREFGTGTRCVWLFGIIAAYAWFVVFPMFVYLVDTKRKR